MSDQPVQVYNEPAITINGVELSFAQSMAVRVAITSFIINMQNSGLGNDAVGTSISQKYLARLSEVEQLMVR